MAASSSTGRGIGLANSLDIMELNSIARGGPNLIFTGISEGESLVTSPPGGNNNILFPYKLPGGSSNYVVILTSLNGGYSYVSSKSEDDDGYFTGFSFIVESDGEIMYMVATIGSKPQVS